MQNILHNKQQLTFTGIAILILIGIGVATYFSLQFLISSAQTALNQDQAAAEQVEHFDLDGYKALNL